MIYFSFCFYSCVYLWILFLLIVALFDASINSSIHLPIKFSWFMSCTSLNDHSFWILDIALNRHISHFCIINWLFKLDSNNRKKREFIAYIGNWTMQIKLTPWNKMFKIYGLNNFPFELMVNDPMMTNIMVIFFLLFLHQEKQNKKYIYFTGHVPKMPRIQDLQKMFKLKLAVYGNAYIVVQAACSNSIHTYCHS